MIINNQSTVHDVDNNIVVKRGNIYDRNKNLLSGNVETYSLSTNPLRIKNQNQISDKLSTTFAPDFSKSLTTFSL